MSMGYCGKVDAGWHMFKYIYKGHDRISFSVETTSTEVEVNEICQFRDDSHETREVVDEMSIQVDQCHVDLYDSLNPKQQYGFDEIMGHVDSGVGNVFFIDGPGGTGKTYLYRA
uniref:ATP-dependent DNA helicase n=1 Tax=Oryza glaberrima TaxID=4538 RepID=I1QYT2_ORYGL